MKLITIIILLLFFIFRNSFTLFKGKRSIAKVTSFIYWGRKLIEIFICFLIPIFLLLEIIETNISFTFYYIGVVISILGLLLMVSTRFNRDKDWGFMGDDTGNVLFTDGPYKFTRHPYYMGAIFVCIGLYLQLNYVLVLMMIPVVLFIMYSIKKEDLFLESKFGQKFVEYKNKVGIFPWFY